MIRTATYWMAALLLAAGCGGESGSAPVVDSAADAQEPRHAEPRNVEPDEPAASVSEQIIEREQEMAEDAPANAADDEPEEEPRKSPIKIVPTRPMFQNDWEEESYDDYGYEDEYEDEAYEEVPESREAEGPSITEYHIRKLYPQQSLNIVENLMPVRGELIDRYYQGRTEYEVWEWRAPNEDGGETLVRIRFMDERAAEIAVNPDEYVLMR